MTQETKAIPLASGKPIVGNVLDLAGDVRAYLFEQYCQLGPIFRLKALNKEYVVLAGPEANLFMTREGKNHFISKDFWQGLDDELGAKRSMISMDGPDHARYRSVQKRGYSRAVLFDQNNIDEVVAITSTQVQQWPVQKHIPGLYAMQRIITEQLGILAASYAPKEYLDDMITFVRTMLLTRVTKQRPGIVRYAPSYRQAKSRAMELAENVRDAHTPEQREGKSPDLIDDLLQLSKDDPEFLPESDLLPALLGPFIAGLDTVASTCAFIFYALLTHPEIMTAATQEAHQLFADGNPNPKQLRELDIINRTVLETLRMYPIAPAMQRTVTEPFTFAGHTVPSGTHVIVATTIPHYLPDLYPNPEVFDIDRYLPERKENKQAGAFAPFGLGAHTCLGAGLAELQMELTVAIILNLCQLELSPPNYELKIEPAPGPRPSDAFGFKVRSFL